MWPAACPPNLLQFVSSHTSCMKHVHVLGNAGGTSNRTASMIPKCVRNRKWQGLLALLKHVRYQSPASPRSLLGSRPNTIVPACFRRQEDAKALDTRYVVPGVVQRRWFPDTSWFLSALRCMRTGRVQQQTSREALAAKMFAKMHSSIQCPDWRKRGMYSQNDQGVFNDTVVFTYVPGFHICFVLNIGWFLVFVSAASVPCQATKASAMLSATLVAFVAMKSFSRGTWLSRIARPGPGRQVGHWRNSFR